MSDARADLFAMADEFDVMMRLFLLLKHHGIGCADCYGGFGCPRRSEILMDAVRAKANFVRAMARALDRLGSAVQPAAPAAPSKEP